MQTKHWLETSKNGKRSSGPLDLSRWPRIRGKLPGKWSRAVLWPVPGEGDLLKCENHQAISTSAAQFVRYTSAFERDGAPAVVQGLSLVQVEGLSLVVLVQEEEQLGLC